MHVLFNIFYSLPYKYVLFSVCFPTYTIILPHRLDLIASLPPSFLTNYSPTAKEKKNVFLFVCPSSHARLGSLQVRLYVCLSVQPHNIPTLIEYLTFTVLSTPGIPYIPTTLEKKKRNELVSPITNGKTVHRYPVNGGMRSAQSTCACLRV